MFDIALGGDTALDGESVLVHIELQDGCDAGATSRAVLLLNNGCVRAAAPVGAVWITASGTVVGIALFGRTGGLVVVVIRAIVHRTRALIRIAVCVVVIPIRLCQVDSSRFFDVDGASDLVIDAGIQYIESQHDHECLPLDPIDHELCLVVSP